jgi:hypothetical protein
MNKETLRMQMLAGIITESQYKERTENLYEASLNPEEKQVFDDIVNTLNEGEGWVEKLKSYAKKGMITLGIISALLGGTALTMDQKQEVVDTVKTEMPAQSEESGYLSDAWMAYSLYNTYGYKEKIDQMAQNDADVYGLVTNFRDLSYKDFKKMSPDEHIYLGKMNHQAIEKIMDTLNIHR